MSIIIPVYNAELYIERCVKSVLFQTYRKLEVILIDDCTPDRSMDFAQSVIKGSPQSGDLTFKYLQHTQNRGQSAARNTGVSAATGSYVFFLDSDDEITPQCIESLVVESENEKYDVVCGDIEVMGPNPLYAFNHKCSNFLNNHEVVKAYVEKHIYMVIWNKLIRREIVQKEVQFKEGITNEDELWSFTLVNKVSSAKNIHDRTYIYYVRPNSLSTQAVTAKKYYSSETILYEMTRLLNAGDIPSYYENITYIQEKRVGWMVAILKSQLKMKEKYNLFHRFYQLPIGDNISFLKKIYLSLMIQLLYPYRSTFSKFIRRIFKIYL